MIEAIAEGVAPTDPVGEARKAAPGDMAAARKAAVEADTAEDHKAVDTKAADTRAEDRLRRMPLEKEAVADVNAKKV